MHCVSHKWERFVAGVNKNNLIEPSDTEIVPLTRRDHIRRGYGDNVGLLINSDNGSGVVRGANENFNNWTPFEVERCERNLNFVVGINT